jgi:hypothetical protein
MFFLAFQLLILANGFGDSCQGGPKGRLYILDHYWKNHTFVWQVKSLIMATSGCRLINSVRTSND